MSDEQTPEKHKREIPWDEIYALWRLGTHHNGELAKRFGLADESAIRKRALRYGWQRDLDEAVRRRTQEKVIERQAGKMAAKKGSEKTLDDLRKALEPGNLSDPDKAPADTPDSAGNGGNAGVPAVGSEADAERSLTQSVEPSVERTHDPVVDLAADMRAAIVEQHCERADDLKKLYAKISGLIWQYIDPPGNDPGERATARAEAVVLLMATKGDSLANHLKFLASLAEMIQRLERQSFAIDGDPRQQKVEVNNTIVQANLSKTEFKVIDWDSLPLEQLEALEALAVAMEAKKV